MNGNALKRARSAGFVTVEQLLRSPLPADNAKPNPVYRVQARLLGYQLEPDQSYLLVLGSLVDPKLTIEARIPSGRCVANQEDAALFDELREDINLHFGPVTETRALLSRPVQVVVTGPAVANAAGVALEPVLNFRVQ